MKKYHHNTTITCEAQNSAESVPQSTSIKLFVEFAPSVTLKKSPAIVKEGDKTQFRCQSHAKPPQVSFQWFLDGEMVDGVEEDGSVLRLDKLNRSAAGKIVKCQVTNSIGKSEETYSLDINCKST